LLATNAFSRAERSKGRFRNFLLGSLRRFLADEQRRSGAEKRGRNKVVLALDFAEVERQYLEEAEPAVGPDEAFARRWAVTVLEAAFISEANRKESSSVTIFLVPSLSPL
jgi:RNA polymerase sigma-70 factor (ECF subfamily)